MSNRKEQSIARPASRTPPARTESQAPEADVFEGEAPPGTPPLRRRRLPEPEVRRLITLKASVPLFAVDGIHGATMEEIAQRAQLPKPVLYRDFGSKEALFETVIQEECRRLTDHLFSTYTRALGLPTRQLIRAGIAAAFEYAERYPDSFRLLFRTGHHRMSGVAETVDRALEGIAGRVAQLVSHEMGRYGTAPGRSAELFGSAMVAMSEAVSRRTTEAGDWDREAVIDLLTEFATAGFFGVSQGTIARANRRPREMARPAQPGARGASQRQIGPGDAGERTPGEGGAASKDQPARTIDLTRGGMDRRGEETVTPQERSGARR